MLKKGDKIAIVGCSNGQHKSYKEKNELLINKLEEMGLKVCVSDYLYETDTYFSGSPIEKANALMNFFKDEEIKLIFDISGGDVANEVIEYLDFEVIKNSNAIFFGYSDLSTIINAIYTKTGKESGLYQIRNLIYEDENNQTKSFINTFFEDKNDLTDFNYYFIQEGYMEGQVIGGNIRCFLKLAGTEYMPDFTDKILLLEGLNTSSAQVATFLSQLKQMKAFEKINGILLGTFTKLDAEIFVPSVEELVQKYAGKDIPVARTMDIGHGTDSKCIMIGKEIKLMGR